MHLNKTQKAILGLLLTAVVTPTNAADDFMDRLLLSAMLKKEVKLEEVKTLVSDWATVHEAIKSEDFRDPDVKVSELVEAIQTSSPNETSLEKASKVGVASKFKDEGLELNEANRQKKKILDEIGCSFYDQEMFETAGVAQDKDLFTAINDFKKADILDVLKEQLAIDPNAGEAEVRPVLALRKVKGLENAKQRHLAAQAALHAGTLGKVAQEVDPTPESIQALARAAKLGKPDPSINRYNDIKTLQAKGIEKPVEQHIAELRNLRLAGRAKGAGIADPTREMIIASVALALGGNNDPTLVDLQQEEQAVLLLQQFIQHIPGGNEIDISDPRIMAAAYYVSQNIDTLNLGQHEVISAIEGTAFLVKRGVIAGADDVEVEHLKALQYFVEKFKVKPSREEFEALMEARNPGGDFKKEKPSRQEIRAIMQLMTEHEDVNPENVETFRVLQVDYKIPNPTMDMEDQRDRLIADGAQNLTGPEIVEADRLAKILNPLHAIAAASIEQVRESIRLAGQQGLDALPSILPNITEGLRLQGVAAGEAKNPTGRQILEGIRLAGLGLADQIIDAHIDVIKDSLRLQGLIGPDRIAAPIKAQLDESARLQKMFEDGEDGIENPTGVQIGDGIALQTTMTDANIAKPTATEIEALRYSKAPTAGAYRNTTKSSVIKAIAYVMLDAENKLGFETKNPNEAVIRAVKKILTLGDADINKKNWVSTLALSTQQDNLGAVGIKPTENQIKALSGMDPVTPEKQNFVAWKIQKEVQAGTADYLPCFLGKCTVKDAAFVTLQILETFKGDADIFAALFDADRMVNGDTIKVTIGANAGQIPVAFAGGLNVDQLVAIGQLDNDGGVADRVFVADIDKR